MDERPITVREFNNLKLILNTSKLDDILFGDGKSYPIQAEIYLTDKCNLNCNDCRRKGVKGSLKTNILLRTLKEMQVGRNGLDGLKSVILKACTGEPTLHKDFNEIVRHIKSIHLNLAMHTNGVRIKYKHLLKLFDYIVINIDAYTKEKYKAKKGKDRLDVIRGNIWELTQRKPANTVIVLDCQTDEDTDYKDVWTFIDSIKTCKPDMLVFRDRQAYYQNVRREWLNQIEVDFQEHFKIRIDGRNEVIGNDNLPCLANSLNTVLLNNGHFIFCKGLMEKNNGVDPYIGDYNHSFNDIWLTGNYRHQFIKDTSKREWCKDNCPDCRLFQCNEFLYKLNIVNKSRFKNFI